MQLGVLAVGGLVGGGERLRVASLMSLLRYGELTIVPSTLAGPGRVGEQTGVPCGAPPANGAVMPSARACLTIRPDSTSSAPMKMTCGFLLRIVGERRR